MDLTPTLPAPVYVVWCAMLLLTVLVVVPLVIVLLHRVLRAALWIRRYFAEMLAAGDGIAGNTAAVAALNETIDVAGGMVGKARSLRERSGGIAGLLAARAAGRGAS